MSRRIVAVAAALATAGLAVGVLVDSGRAQSAGRTITITEGKTVGAAADVEPKGLGRGRGSLGDELTISGPVSRDDGARGRLQGTFTIGQKQTSLVRSSGHLSAVFHFADGDLYVVGYITFDDSDIDHGAIVGGTGVYAGARGTVDSAAAKDTVHLLP